MSLVIVERDDRVARVRIHDPDNQNALSEALVNEVTATLARVADDESVHAVILTGTDEIFCSGGDSTMLRRLADGEVAPSDIVVSRAVLDMPVPIIALMTGHGVGGGLVLGLCCDVVLMAEESSYGCSFMNMGFTPGMGTTRLLQLAMGEYIAAEMMYGGQNFRGRHFAARTAVNYVLPKAKLERKASSIARRIAQKPRAALTTLKESLASKKRALFEEAHPMEASMHEKTFALPETKALIEAHFERHKA